MAASRETRVTVYTDGACSGNPGPGGWAWAVAPAGQPWASGAQAATTNQQMELRAAIEALRALPPGPVHVMTDSTYVRNCFRDRWYERWEANGWRNAKKQPVANAGLWQQLLAQVRARPAVTWDWVKGHSGDRMNDLVDRLAVAAATTQRGGASPGRLAGGAGDGAGGAGAADEDGPAGQASLF